MELPTEIMKLVEQIANDKLSGASTVAKNASECLDTFAGWVIENASDITLEDYLECQVTLGRVLINAQPAMAPVVNAVNSIITSLKHEMDNTAPEQGADKASQLIYLCTFTQSAVRKYIVQSKLALESIGRSYQDLINDPGSNTIMTISSSSAVEILLTTAFSESVDITVYVPESRPMYEGRLFAERLANNGLNSILIADSAMFHFLKNCDSVIVGSDRVVPSGMINKIGTYGLAIAAKELKIPFYCVCELSKFINDSAKTTLEQPSQPENQLYSPNQDEKKPAHLTIKNIYFDFTPMEYITGFLTEDGLLTADQVREHINNVIILLEPLQTSSSD